MAFKFLAMLWLLTTTVSTEKEDTSIFVQISSNLQCELRENQRDSMTLDCSRKKLNQVPDFGSLKKDYTRSIREINLSRNNIEKLDSSSFNMFPKLQTLILCDNKLQNVTLTNSKPGLERIRKLYLNRNSLTEVPVTFLQRMKKLEYLNIRKNLITVLRNDSFKGLDQLESVDIFRRLTKVEKDDEKNPIYVEIGAFRYMSLLRNLYLDPVNVHLESFPDLNGTSNLREITIFGIENLKIPDDFCDTHQLLDYITIERSTMKTFPSLSKCRNLQAIEFTANTIGEISKNAFSGLPLIKTIEIFKLQNTVTKIHPDAFSNMTSLLELDLSHFPLKTFPNLRGTTNLEKLSLQFCSIESIPDNVCDDKPGLKNLDLNQNKLTNLPSLSRCTELEFLDLYHNRIRSLTNQFRGLSKLEFLKLTDNHLTTIPSTLFGSLKALVTLHLADNVITRIDENAFQNVTNLRVLDVSNNKLRHLPHKGLQSVTDIIANNNKGMIHFPTQQELPHAKRLRLDYHYHCCFFLKRVQQIHRTFTSIGLSASESQWMVVDGEEKSRIKNGMLSRQKHNNNNSTQLLDNTEHIDPLIQLLRELNNHTILYVTHTSNDEKETLKDYLDRDGYCLPTPNEFYPCEDLMGKEWLRVCVWIVFFLALLGNITVLLVLFFNYSKLDVPRYLVMNLSFADLCLGVYLGFLAFVDIRTIGDFREHALNWQFSGSCKFAGFLAVFSSELSVYTLTMITVERFLTIKNSMYVDKRITRNQAFFIMGFGWLFSLFVATLPLFEGNIKFNDYTKYSVCLPFETETLTSRIYLMFLLGLNLLAFVIILFCYIKVYLFIRGSNAWNSGDLRVARRMAILVFTDFLCWFPIALVALSAVFKNPFISDLWVSKVITIFIFPLNACANPFLYAIFTKQFRKDLVSAIRHLKDRITNQRDIRKSLLKLPIKGSLTYSTSVRRGSSCSFLFGRRLSAKPDVESKRYSRNAPIITPSFEEPDEDDFQERLTSL